jgi:hypothetical protein
MEFGVLGRLQSRGFVNQHVRSISILLWDWVRTFEMQAC